MFSTAAVFSCPNPNHIPISNPYFELTFGIADLRQMRSWIIKQYQLSEITFISVKVSSTASRI